MTKLIKITLNQEDLNNFLREYYYKQLDVGQPFSKEDIEIDWTNFFETKNREISILLSK